MRPSATAGEISGVAIGTAPTSSPLLPRISLCTRAGAVSAPAHWPVLLAWRYSFDVAATAGEAPYFAVFEGDFADAAAMAAARASPQGQRVAAEVANYATGGAVIIHHPVQDGTG